jgi:UDP-N-acetylmuramyl tripeptide synthase
MRYLDARRLTGPNLLAKTPLVVVEVALAPGEAPDAERRYRSELARICGRVGVPVPAPSGDRVRVHTGGAVFAFEAPFDVMLAYTEVAELAAIAASEAPNAALEDEAISRVVSQFAAEQNPALLALLAAGAARGVAVLADDDGVSVGLGVHSVYYARAEIPPVDAVPFGAAPVPIALITGTNGKTTSSRLLAHIAGKAGFTVGATSTDGVLVGGVLQEKGDCTGPAAAREVLRNRAVDFAVLETARGGILRRGLALAACDVALLTNVSGDHLGDYGIEDAPQMAEAKAVIADGAKSVVVNGADPVLVELAAKRPWGAPETLVLFADFSGVDAARVAAAARAIAVHRGAGGRFVVARDGTIYAGSGAAEELLFADSLAPITFGGAARYNVENVLGVVAAARALGLPSSAIAEGVASFGAAENPGRGTLVTKGDARIFLDFGHNPDGVRALVPLVAALRAGSGLTVIAGLAGDRSDEDIAAVAMAIVAMGPDRVYVRELEHYLRGRELGEISELFAKEFDAHPPVAFARATSEVDALQRSVAAARGEKGHLVVLLVHVDHDAVAAYLAD